MTEDTVGKRTNDGFWDRFDRELTSNSVTGTTSELRDELAETHSPAEPTIAARRAAGNGRVELTAEVEVLHKQASVVGCLTDWRSVRQFMVSRTGPGTDVRVDVQDDPSLIERFEDSNFLEGYARRVIDPIIESRIEQLATYIAITDHGMNPTDAEFIADRACANLAGAMGRNPELKERLATETDMFGAYLRKTIARLCYELNRHKRRTRARQALSGRFLPVMATDESRRRYDEILDAAIEEAGLTDIEKRRINKVRRNMNNVEIGNDEGVGEVAIRKSVKLATEKIKWKDMVATEQKYVSGWAEAVGREEAEQTTTSKQAAITTSLFPTCADELEKLCGEDAIMSCVPLLQKNKNRQVAFLLWFIEDYSYQQIASYLEVTPQAAGRYVRTACAIILEALQVPGC